MLAHTRDLVTSKRYTFSCHHISGLGLQHIDLGTSEQQIRRCATTILVGKEACSKCGQNCASERNCSTLVSEWWIGGRNQRATEIGHLGPSSGSRPQAFRPVPSPSDLVICHVSSLVLGLDTHAELLPYFLHSTLWLRFPSLILLQVHSLKLALEGVEKERDFYFGKLREIELLCQEHGQENDDLVQRLMDVLYASEEHVSELGPPLPSSEVASLTKEQ